MAAGDETALKAEMERIFGSAPFVEALGIRMVEVATGRCVSELVLERRHQQQDGVVHAGVMATIADHTAGGAAATMVQPGEIVLGAGFTIHLLRPASGERLLCVATVLKPGRRVSIVESEVWCVAGEDKKLVAKATVSIAVVPGAQLRRSP